MTYVGPIISGSETSFSGDSGFGNADCVNLTMLKSGFILIVSVKLWLLHVSKYCLSKKYKN